MALFMSPTAVRRHRKSATLCARARYFGVAELERGSAPGNAMTPAYSRRDPIRYPGLLRIVSVASLLCGLAAIGIPLPAGGNWVRSVNAQSGETLTVKDFGAKGDGITDDTATIQAAINATPPGGTLSVPPGQYLLSGSGTELLLVSGKAINLVCSGWGNTQFTVASSVPGTTDVLRLQGPSVGFVMQNCKFVPQSGTPARNAVNLDATSAKNGQRIISQFVLSHNYFGGFGGKGIVTTFPTYRDGVFNGAIENSEIVNGVLLDRAGDLLAIRHNTILGRGPGIEVTLMTGPSSNQLKIEHNTITTCSGGIVVNAGGKMRLQDNYIEPSGKCANVKSTHGALVELLGSVSAPLAGVVLDGNLYSLTPGTADYAIYADYATFLSLADTFSFGTADQRGIQTTTHSASALLLYSTTIGTDYSALTTTGASGVTLVMPNGALTGDTGTTLAVRPSAPRTPANLGPGDGDSCVTGEMFFDSDYVYVCVVGSTRNTSTIKRGALM